MSVETVDGAGVGKTGSSASEPTVRERLLRAEVSERRIMLHFDAGAITLNGDVVSDLNKAAPYGSRINFIGR